MKIRQTLDELGLKYEIKPEISVHTRNYRGYKYGRIDMTPSPPFRGGVSFSGSRRLPLFGVIENENNIHIFKSYPALKGETLINSM